ncbi:MAG TPA: hypothetical protein VF681_14340 [Abditibacteriaceae bacterium]|jgi:hypothetical protein
MKTHSTHFDNRRPHWWVALLVLCVTFSVAAQPSRLCAFLETLPGHSPADSVSHSHSHSHDHAGDTHAAHSHPAHGDIALPHSAPGEHNCCVSSESAPVLAGIQTRPASPEEKASLLAFMPLVLPQAQEIVAVTACHGRDGPNAAPYISQLLRSQLLGRAPPFSA